MMNAYNDLQFDTSFTVSMQMDAVPEGQRAQDCIQCESCVQMCPQGIDIPTVLEDLAATLDKMPKVGRFVPRARRGGSEIGCAITRTVSAVCYLRNPAGQNGATVETRALRLLSRTTDLALQSS